MNKQLVLKYAIGALVLTMAIIGNGNSQSINKSENKRIMSNNRIMNELKQDTSSTTGDNSNKSILARGCDPQLSLEFSKLVPPLIGNASYIPTTNDVDFIEQLQAKKWSVVYFAPGACRWSAAKKPIPGGNLDTEGWTLEQYKELIIELQGKGIKIVETPYEHEAVTLLNQSLETARAVKQK